MSRLHNQRDYFGSLKLKLHLSSTSNEIEYSVNHQCRPHVLIKIHHLLNVKNLILHNSKNKSTPHPQIIATIPKNQARLVVSRPGTGTFIPQRPVTTFMGTIMTVNNVSFPRRELMRLFACIESTDK